MGDLVQIRDWQSKRAIERAHKKLEKEAVKILSAVDTSPSEMNPGCGIEGLWVDADPA